jgi:hypothetical protein
VMNHQPQISIVSAYRPKSSFNADIHSCGSVDKPSSDYKNNYPTGQTLL